MMNPILPPISPLPLLHAWFLPPERTQQSDTFTPPTSDSSPHTLCHVTHPTTMTIQIDRLDHIWQVVNMWPLISSVANADGKGFDATGLLSTLALCMKQGAVFMAYIEGRFAGFASVEVVGPIGVVHNLPTACGVDLGKIALNAIRKWAFTQGIAELNITLNSSTGSGHSYVRKYLGFHRKAETYALKV